VTGSAFMGGVMKLGKTLATGFAEERPERHEARDQETGQPRRDERHEESRPPQAREEVPATR
jgi:hypothetical protein